MFQDSETNSKKLLIILENYSQSAWFVSFDLSMNSCQKQFFFIFIYLVFVQLFVNAFFMFVILNTYFPVYSV